MEKHKRMQIKMASDLGTSNEIRIKIISLGAAETGKSCLIKRYCEKRFVSIYMATLGIDFGVTRVKTSHHKVKVNIFDLAGQPFFVEVRNEFYKDTQGVLLVYDITSRESFDCLNGWMKEMRSNLNSPADMDAIVFVLCANKTDLGGREVQEAEGRIWAEAKGFPYFETSAQTGENVQKMFDILFQHTVEAAVTGRHQLAQPDLPYTPEQVKMVSKIRHCKDGYQMLGLNKTCSKEDVIKAYKHLAVLLHPDKNLAPGSEEAFKCISTAKEVLLKTCR